MHRAECAWPATPQSVRSARAFVQSQLEEWDSADLAWPAVSIVSELATNAVLHARTEFSVEVELLADGRLHLRVGDRSSNIPIRRHYDEEAATGRGIALVEALTAEWGITPTDAGKVVWCVVVPDGGAGSRTTDTRAQSLAAHSSGTDERGTDPLATFDDGSDGFLDVSAHLAFAA